VQELVVAHSGARPGAPLLPLPRGYRAVVSAPVATDHPQIVAWLGLGAMGTPMAARLRAAGHDVRAYDPHGGPEVGAGTPALAAAGCDVLMVMVATPEQATQALFGEHGAAASLRPGSRVVLLGTLGPDWVRGLQLPDGVRVVDAPVSGGVTRAATGELLVMAAGARAEDTALLEVFGEVVPVGDEPGQGQAMKLVNQVLCGVHIAAAAEALALAERLGIDPRLAWDTVRQGAAASFMLEDRGARMVAGPDGTVRSAVQLFVKDLHLVLDEADRTGLQTPVAAAAARLFADAGDAGLLRADDARLFDHVRSGSGGDRQPPPDPQDD
jgi:3-hydroxyisobutyrate dehydrogenase